MELSLLLTEKICSMAFMILFGFLIVKLKVLKSEDSRVLSAVAVYIICPCTFINAFQIEFSAERLSGLGVALLGAGFVNVFYILITKLVEKPLRLENVERASIIYTNAGNLIIPLVTATLGKEWTFYSSAYILIQTIFIWTHGKSLICGTKERNIRKILLNPNMLAIFAGLILFLCRISLPKVLLTTVETVSGTLGAVSMFIMGMLLGRVKKRQLKSIRLYLIVFVRLTICPLMVIAFFVLSGITRIHVEAQGIMLIVLLASAAPTASTVTNIAQVTGGDGTYSSTISTVGMLGCIVTMPVMVMIYQYFTL